MKPKYYALIGSLVLPLGGVSWIFVFIGGFSLLYGVLKLLEELSLYKLKTKFAYGLLLAILGGMWARHTLACCGFDIKRLLFTSILSGTGLYFQYEVYEKMAKAKGCEELMWGGLLLVIGAATFWFLVGFIPLVLGVLLIAYAFWKW